MAGKNTKSILQFVVLLSIGILLIWLSLSGITPAQKQEIIVAFQTANYFWIIIAMAVSFLSHFLRAYRWNYLLKPVGYQTKLIECNMSCAGWVFCKLRHSAYGRSYALHACCQIR